MSKFKLIETLINDLKSVMTKQQSELDAYMQSYKKNRQGELSYSLDAKGANKSLEYEFSQELNMRTEEIMKEQLYVLLNTEKYLPIQSTVLEYYDDNFKKPNPSSILKLLNKLLYDTVSKDLQKLITKQDEVLYKIYQKEIKKTELIDELIAELKPMFKIIESNVEEWVLKELKKSNAIYLQQVIEIKNTPEYLMDDTYKESIDKLINELESKKSELESEKSELESEKSELLIGERHKRMTKLLLDIILNEEKYSDIAPNVLHFNSINNQKSPPDDIITLLESLKKDILDKSNKLSGVGHGGYKRQSSVKKYKKRRINRVHTKHKHKKRRYFTYKK
jgi:hypothetical protein